MGESYLWGDGRVKEEGSFIGNQCGRQQHQLLQYGASQRTQRQGNVGTLSSKIKITSASPKISEFIAMANALSLDEKFDSITKDFQSIESIFQMLKPAICALLEKGIKVLIITLGSYGVFLRSTEGLDFMNQALNRRTVCSSGKQLYELVNKNRLANQFLHSIKTRPESSLHANHFPSLPASVVSLTGAGDCLIGGILASICAGMDVMQITAVGIAVAKAVEAESNVPTKDSLKTVSDEAVNILAAAKPLVFT